MANLTIINDKMENLNLVTKMPQVPIIVSVSCCFTLSLIFVASLYVWNTDLDRDHPSTVKRRFCSVFVVMLIAPIFLYTFSAEELLTHVSFFELLGLRTQSLLQAIFIPYLLTMLLFLGPLVEELQNDTMKLMFDFGFWKHNLMNLLWLRNHIVAPLSEEFVYRACMMPLILQSFSPVASVFITPLFFGTAHVHHIVERLRMGIEWKTALLISCFQMLYTTLFGFYSAYLFARTGHFVAPFLVHAFCNHMGIPGHAWASSQLQLHRRLIIIFAYIIGFVGWILLLPIATDPRLYSNNLFWKT